MYKTTKSKVYEYQEEEVVEVVEVLVSCPPGRATFKIGSHSLINSTLNIRSILTPERGSLYR